MEAYEELAALPSRRNNSKPDGRRPQRRPVKTGPAKPAEPAEPLGADPLRPWMERLSRELNSIRSEMGALKRQVANPPTVPAQTPPKAAAYRGQGRGGRGGRGRGGRPSRGGSNSNSTNFPARRPGQPGATGNGGRGNPRECWGCGSTTHFRRNCPQNSCNLCLNCISTLDGEGQYQEEGSYCQYCEGGQSLN